MLVFVRTSVECWKSPFCDELDAFMLTQGAIPVDLPWSNFQLLQQDQDHFTARGFDAFRRSFATELRQKGIQGNALIMTDSTVDHLNRNNRAKPADKMLKDSLEGEGIHAIVASQSGSGFCAMQEHELNFHSLALKCLQKNGPRLKNAHWVVVGGWNDESQGYSMNETTAAVKRLFRLKEAA